MYIKIDSPAKLTLAHATIIIRNGEIHIYDKSTLKCRISIIWNSLMKFHIVKDEKTISKDQ